MIGKIVASYSPTLQYDFNFSGGPNVATKYRKTKLGKIIVEARDYSNNLLNAFNGTATIAINAPATITGGSLTYNFVNGVCTIDPSYNLVYDGNTDVPFTITISASTLDPFVFSPIYFKDNYLIKQIALVDTSGHYIQQIELESESYLNSEFIVAAVDKEGKPILNGFTGHLRLQIVSSTPKDSLKPIVYLGSYSFVPSNGTVSLSPFCFINPGMVVCSVTDESTSGTTIPYTFTVNVKPKVNKELDQNQVPKKGRLLTYPSYARMQHPLVWRGRPLLGVSNPIKGIVCEASNEPIATNMSDAGVFYSETKIEVENAEYIYYLPSEHFSVGGTATRPYNVLVSKSFEDDRILSLFLSQECLEVYEDLEIMLCAPNDYAYLNSRPSQLDGKRNCDAIVTGDLNLHSYVASVVPVVGNDGGTRFDRESCVSVCEGFFEKCFIMKPPTGSTNMMDYHVNIPCMVAKKHNEVTGTDIATVAVAITNFGVHPPFRQDAQYYYTSRLQSYPVEPLNCPHGSNILTSTFSQADNPQSSLSLSGTYTGIQQFDYKNWAAYFSKEFGFSAQSPEYPILGSNDPMPIESWGINTFFRNPLCNSVGTASGVVKPFGYSSEFPVDHYDTSAGIIATSGKCIDFPPGYSYPLETGEQQGCPGTPEEFWSFGFRLTPKDNRNLDQKYCVIPVSLANNCSSTSSSYGSQSDLVTEPQVSSMVFDVRNDCDNQFKVTSSTTAKEITKKSNYPVPEDRFVGGRYVVLSLRCAPLAGVDYLTMETEDVEYHKWVKDTSSVKLDLDQLERVRQRYHSIEYHHFPSDPQHPFDSTEFGSRTSASAVQRLTCVEDFYSKYKSQQTNVFFFCYNQTFRKTELYDTPAKLAAYIRYLFRDTKSKSQNPAQEKPENPAKKYLETSPPTSTSSGITLVSINYAGIDNGATIGNGTVKGPDISDAYCGPNGYKSMYPDATWGAIPMLAPFNSEKNSFKRGIKDGNTNDIWTARYHVTFSSGRNSSSSPFCIVVDLGSVRSFNMARYYQSYLSGKITHAALDISTSGNLETRTSSNWVEVHPYKIIDNPTETADGLSDYGTVATFDMTTARYLRVRVYNDGRYGTNDTALYLFKLFKVI